MSEAPIDQQQYQSRLQSYSPHPQSSTSIAHPSTAAGSSRRQSSQTPTRTASASSKRRPSSKSAAFGHTGVFSHDSPSSSMPNVMDAAAEITYTPTTGRISKAKKGKKVHVCEYPGCGKVFSRAEHRKRHEANHNPEPLYTCDVGDCRRPFQRQDLLTRHLERQHNISAPSSSGSKDRRRRTSSLASSATPSQANSPVIVTSMTSGKPSTSTNLQDGISSAGALTYTPAISFPQPAAELECPPWDNPMANNNLPPEIYELYTSDESPPDSCYSPMSENSQQMYTTQPYPSYNPVPARSNSYSTEYQPQTYALNRGFPSWTGQYDPLPQALNGQSFGFEGQFPTPVDSSKPANTFMARNNRQLDLRRESTHAASMATGQHGMVRADKEALQEYHLCYWKHFHSILPIVHYATYSASSPPQLSTIMLAIGAQFSRRPLAKSHSQQMFEISSKLLSLMPEITSRSPVSDLQSLILREAFSLYRSRSPGVQQSPQFINLYSGLLNNRKLLDVELPPITRLSDKTRHDKLHIARQDWAELEARRRVLLAAFVLDTQRSIYFPQQAQPAFAAVNGAKLPSPCPQEMWDCVKLSQWRDHFSRHRTQTLGCASPSFSRFHTNILQCLNIHCNSPPNLASLATVQTTCASHHSLLAATNTPIPSLLIVAAESWLYARKIEDPTRWTSAKMELRNWADSDIASKAVWHAGYVLRSVLGDVDAKCSEDGLHGEWILYLASLICWAYGFSRESRDWDINANFATLTQQERETQTWDYLHALEVENWRDVERLRGRGRTRPILEWVRGKMASAGGRLICEGQTVLDRLIEGRGRSCEF